MKRSTNYYHVHPNKPIEVLFTTVPHNFCLRDYFEYSMHPFCTAVGGEKKNTVSFDLQIRLLKDGTTVLFLPCVCTEEVHLYAYGQDSTQPKRAVSVSETNWSSQCKGQNMPGV